MYEATPRYTPVMVVAMDGRVPVAQLMGIVHTIAPFVKRCDVFGCGSYDYSVADREELFGEMLGALKAEVKAEAAIVEVRNLSNATFGYKEFRHNGFFPVSWMRVHNSLHSQKSAESRLSQSRLRQIRKALKSGVVVEQATSSDDIHELSRLMRSHFKRRMFPFIDFFTSSIDALAGDSQVRIFVVRYNGRIIGGSACFYTVTDAYLLLSVGMRKVYAAQYPGVMAVWAALSDAYERGFSHLEFMDAGIPFRRHGYRDFILRFGGKQSSTRRWFLLRATWLNKLMTKIYL
jgi:hypothetical protein